MPDWTAIREEYITGDISLRQLAEEHGISFNTLKDRVKREKWGEARRDYRIMMGVPLVTPKPKQEPKEKKHHKATTGTTRPPAPQPIIVVSPPPDADRERVTRMYAASEAVLEKLLTLLDRCSRMREIRDAAAALKDIREIQMIRDALDTEEAQARIAKLKAEVQQQTAGNAEPVEICFVGETEEAAT